MGCSGEKSLREDFDNFKQEINIFKKENLSKIENLEKENKDFKNQIKDLSTKNKEFQENKKKDNEDFEKKIKDLKAKNQEFEGNNKNLKNNLNQVSNELNSLKEKQKEIPDLKNKINKLQKENEKLHNEIENNKNKNDKRIDKICIDVNDLKSQLNINKENNNNKFDSSEKEMQKMKKDIENIYDKINNLENMLKQLQEQQLKYSEEKNKMEVESINDNLIQEEVTKSKLNNSNGGRMEIDELLKEKSSIQEEIRKLKNEASHLGNLNDRNKRIFNNFINQPIINICFKIDNQFSISVPAYPTDRLGNLFSLALTKNNIHFPWHEHYKFFFDARNVSSNFKNNDLVTSLNLNNNCVIQVYS